MTERRVVRPTIRLGLQPGTRALRLERNASDNEKGGGWVLWISPNTDFTAGTYMYLRDNGSIERVTLHEDGTETTFLVRQPDTGQEKL